MPNNIESIKAELEELGFETMIQNSPQGETVVFDYSVTTGRHRGEHIKVGISMHGNESYPEYPPHWIHITPPLHDGKGGAVAQYTDESGNQWVVMSRPPGQIWDALPTKHMRGYLNEFFPRFWYHV